MNGELVRRFCSDVYKIRRSEREIFEFYRTGQMADLAHLYIGEKAVAASACAITEARDYITPAHRGRGYLAVRGADMGRMAVEILGGETGYSKDKGGSIRVMAMDLGIPNANGAVGGGIPMVTGAGYLARYRGTDQVAPCFLGDGTANEGTFHESISMAAAWDLPAMYVIENNLYGVTMDSRRITKEHDLTRRVIGYGTPSYAIDSNDAEAVHKTMQKAARHARESKEPPIVECKTYRHHGHNGNDSGTHRPLEEVKAWKARNPLTLFRDKGYLTEKEHKEIKGKVEQKVQTVCKFVAENPYPEASELMDDTFRD